MLLSHKALVATHPGCKCHLARLSLAQRQNAANALREWANPILKPTWLEPECLLAILPRQRTGRTKGALLAAKRHRANLAPQHEE